MIFSRYPFTMCCVSYWRHNSFVVSLQRLPNGSIHPDDEASRSVEVQELLEKQNFELAQAKERLSALAATVAELEEDLSTARRDLIKSEEMSSKYQRDLREVREHKQQKIFHRNPGSI